MSRVENTREPRNRPEAAFFNAALRAGWSVTRRGWPDFFCWRIREDGTVEFALVEVKPQSVRSAQIRGRRALKLQQQAVLAYLASLGAPCYRWSPEDGWTKITPPEEDPPA